MSKTTSMKKTTRTKKAKTKKNKTKRTKQWAKKRNVIGDTLLQAKDPNCQNHWPPNGPPPDDAFVENKLMTGQMEHQHKIVFFSRSMLIITLPKAF